MSKKEDKHAQYNYAFDCVYMEFAGALNALATMVKLPNEIKICERYGPLEESGIVEHNPEILVRPQGVITPYRVPRKLSK